MARRKKNKKDDGIPSRLPNGRPLSSRMRSQSRRPGFNKLRAMTCFSEVHERLTKGWPTGELARWIQDEMLEYADAEHATLVGVLTRYRSSLPPGERAKHTLPQSHLDAIEEVEDILDELQTYANTIRDQVKRYKKGMAIEDKIGTLLPGLGQEIRIVGELLKGSAGLKMDLGLNERHLGTVDIEATLVSNVKARYAGTEVEKVIENPKSRRRLAGIAEHLMSLADRGIAVERSEEGELQLVQEDPQGTPSDS